MKKTSITILLGIIITNLYAQEPKKIIEFFFKKYNESGSKVAIKYAVSTNPWLENDTIITKKWKTRLVQISNRKGNYCGYEILETIETGNSLTQIECLVKHEKAPFKISIIFYKPKTKWQMNNIIIGRSNQPNRRRVR